MKLNTKLLDYINSPLFELLEGACNVSHLVGAALMDAFQKELGVTGSIGEIGVRDGKFIFGMTTLLSVDEKAAAIDIFENQHLNVDKSGYKAESHGNPFSRHKDEFLPDSKWAIIDGDSLGLTIRDKINLHDTCGDFRIFSIDGGHDPEHVINDINFINDITCSGAIIILDDYYNAGFPGVHEGVISYLKTYPKWKPFMYGHNKMYLCTHTYFPKYTILRNRYCESNSELLIQDWKTRKEVEICGTRFKNVMWSNNGLDIISAKNS